MSNWGSVGIDLFAKYTLLKTPELEGWEMAYNAFGTELEQGCKKMDYFFQIQQMQPMYIVVALRCPHAYTWVQQMNLATNSVEEGKYMARMVIETMRSQCQVHVSAPPAMTSPTYVGMGGTSIIDQLTVVFPSLGTVKRKCPACANQEITPTSLGILIPHINDTHRWSREKIADWLDIIALDPDVDLTIKPKEKRDAQPSVGPGKKQNFAGFGDWSKWVEGEYVF